MEQPTSPTNETFTLTASPCYPNRHLTPIEDSVYNLLRRLSHKKDSISYSAESIADLYGREDDGRRSVSRDTITDTIKSLILKGWVWRKPRPFKTAKGVYRVLSHEEWVTEHPGKCPIEDQGACANGRKLACANGGKLPSDFALTDANYALTDANYAPTDATKRNTNVSLKGLAAASDPAGTANPSVLDSHDTSPENGACANGGKVYTVPPPALPPIPHDLTDKLTNIVLIPQRLDGIAPDALKLVERQPAKTVDMVLDWAMREPFWMEKIVGGTALKNFIRFYPTIARQMVAEMKRKKAAPQLKSESVKAKPGYKFMEKQ